jgi:hypothetical protein
LKLRPPAPKASHPYFHHLGNNLLLIKIYESPKQQFRFTPTCFFQYGSISIDKRRLRERLKIVSMILRLDWGVQEIQRQQRPKCWYPWLPLETFLFAIASLKRHTVFPQVPSNVSLTLATNPPLSKEIRPKCSSCTIYTNASTEPLQYHNKTLNTHTINYT